MLINNRGLYKQGYRNRKRGRKPHRLYLSLLYGLLTLLCGLIPTVVMADINLAPESLPQVYETVPSNLSLQSASRFIVLDDFNRGQMESPDGTTWRIKAPEIGALDLSLEKEDSRSERRGRSLKAKFHLMAGERVSWRRLFQRIDVSQAEYLVFRYRLESDKPFGGKIIVSMTDGNYKRASYEIASERVEVSKAWKDVILPLKYFEGIDFDQFFSLRFSIQAEKSELSGSLRLDEIAFFGQEDLEFECRRDNLKGFPEKSYDETARQKLLRETDSRRLLEKIARDTWKYFENARDKETHLIVDHLRVGEISLAADYTSPTNIAMDLLAVLTAREMGFISKDGARKTTRNILETLKQLKRYKGFFYNFYHTRNLLVTRSYVSTVDNGWLATALVVVRQAYGEEIHEIATSILDSISFDKLLDSENKQLVIGLEVPEKDFGKYHYGMLISEARATSLYAIGKGDIPRDHWWFLFRTPPQSWTWQNQKPKGEVVSYDEADVFEGYYEYNGKKFVPSWGGSLFEFLMPTLVLKTRELAPKSFGLNNRIVAEIHRDYALIEKKYPVWGISPAATSDGRRWRYEEYGIKGLAVKGYPDKGILTPHVSFLALDVLPEDAIINIQNFLKFPIYGEYGFYDSLDAKRNQVNPQYLALDQGMILAALCNYLRGGVIQEYFHQDPVGKAAEDLLMKERFFGQ
ncbi:MAG: DUF3131 domain-containing protein [Candidatus Omnitrophica bacterium]|nr:DUF3131 domain-containing protein [Candidatus Omnitrophota bacterium]